MNNTFFLLMISLKSQQTTASRKNGSQSSFPTFTRKKAFVLAKTEHDISISNSYSYHGKSANIDWSDLCEPRPQPSLLNNDLAILALCVTPGEYQYKFYILHQITWHIFMVILKQAHSSSMGFPLYVSVWVQTEASSCAVLFSKKPSLLTSSEKRNDSQYWRMETLSL